MNNAQLLIETQKLGILKTNHVLHLLLSIISIGMWIPIWILVALSNAIERGKAERRIDKIINQPAGKFD